MELSFIRESALPTPAKNPGIFAGHERFKTGNSPRPFPVTLYRRVVVHLVESRPASQPSAADLAQPPQPHQLESIKAQLDLILLALEALVGISSEAMLEAAKQLGLGALMGDRVALWRLRQASPLRKGQGRKKLDVDEARGLVLVSIHLAQQHQAKIRQAVSLLEKATAQNKPLHRIGLLGDYLDTFSNFYEERMTPDETLTIEHLRDLALKLLVDLLFYSQSGGTRRLWLTLLDRAR